MPQLIVNLDDKNDIAKAIAILSGNAAAPQSGAGSQITSAPKADEFDDLLSGGADNDDLLGGSSASSELDDLIGGDATPEPKPPPVPTVQDMKKAIQAAIDSKGKDKTSEMVDKILKKLGCTLSQIPDEKKENFITVLNTFAAKK